MLFNIRVKVIYKINNKENVIFKKKLTNYWTIFNHNDMEKKIKKYNKFNNYFFEKSLKHNRNLFCNRGGGSCTVDSCTISGLLSPLFLSYRWDRNTVAISMGPRFTVVPVQEEEILKTNKKHNNVFITSKRWFFNRKSSFSYINIF